MDEAPDSEDAPGSSSAKASVLALTAIPIEVKQGEEQPSSAASPLHTLPTVSHLGVYFTSNDLRYFGSICPSYRQKTCKKMKIEPNCALPISLTLGWEVNVDQLR